jgi:F-type H+-transporting ATPase subunit b
MAEQIERRTKMAEQKIAQAEAAAVKDVRSAASELAIAAAAQIIDKDVKGAKAASLVDDTISSLRKQLN